MYSWPVTSRCSAVSFSVPLNLIVSKWAFNQTTTTKKTGPTNFRFSTHTNGLPSCCVHFMQKKKQKKQKKKHLKLVRDGNSNDRGSGQAESATTVVETFPLYNMQMMRRTMTSCATTWNREVDFFRVASIVANKTLIQAAVIRPLIA